MAKLTDEEQAQLDALSAKRDAPDEEPKGDSRIFNFTIDLSDEGAVARALKLGFLKESDLDDAGGDGGDGGTGDDGGGDGGTPPPATPRRRGYFPQGAGGS